MIHAFLAFLTTKTSIFLQVYLGGSGPLDNARIILFPGDLGCEKNPEIQRKHKKSGNPEKNRKNRTPVIKRSDPENLGPMSWKHI